jgi:hypothetical protein
VSNWVFLIPSALTAVVLLTSPPPLSDDVYRYLFDGSCVHEGFSPFSHAPNSPKVADLVAALPGRINHRHLPTIYPPGAQGLFGVLRTLGLGVGAWRIFLLGALVGAAMLLGRLRPRIGSVGTSAWVVSHPLALLTAAGNGNLDVVGLVVIAAVAHTAKANRDRTVGVLLAIGAALKLFPIGLWAATIGSKGAWRSLRILAVSGACLALAYAPFVSSGPKAFGSLGEYGESWEFNGSLQPMMSTTLAAAMERVGVPENVRVGRADSVTYYTGEPNFGRWLSRRQLASLAAKAAGALALVAIALMTWKRRLDFPTSSTFLLAALFGFSAVVHPWYLLWLMAPSVLSSNRIALGWCASAVLAFWAPAAVLDGGYWHEPLAVRVIEYGIPVLIALHIRASLTRLRAKAYSQQTPAAAASPSP